MLCNVWKDRNKIKFRWIQGGQPQEFLGGCAEDHFILEKSKSWRIVDTGMNLKGSSPLCMNKR